jgi:hypothetical protein
MLSYLLNDMVHSETTWCMLVTGDIMELAGILAHAVAGVNIDRRCGNAKDNVEGCVWMKFGTSRRRRDVAIIVIAAANDMGPIGTRLPVSAWRPIL